MRPLTTFIISLFFAAVNAQSTFQIGLKDANFTTMTLFNATTYHDTCIMVTGVTPFFGATFTTINQKGKLLQTKSIESGNNPFYVFAPTILNKHYLISYDTLQNKPSIRVDVINDNFENLKSKKIPLQFKNTWSNYVHTINNKGELYVVTEGDEPWPNNFKYTIYKFDTLGNVLLSKEYNAGPNTFITSVIADKDDLFLVGQSDGKGFYHHIDNEGNTLESRILNFLPYYIQIDKQSNLILYGTSFDKKSTIVIKADKNMQPYWSKKLSSDDQYYQYRGGTTTNKIIIDKQNNILLVDGNDTGENYEGLKVIKLNEAGDIVFSRLLLDNELQFIYSVFEFMDELVVLSFGTDRSRIRKISSDIKADDCASYEYCTSSDDFDLNSQNTILSGRQGLPAFESPVRLPKDIEIRPFHSCKPQAPPYSDFGSLKEKYCTGESLEIDTSQIYLLGFSEWTLSNDEKSETSKGKRPSFNPLQIEGNHLLIHKLTILGCTLFDSVRFNVMNSTDVFVNIDTTLCFGNSLTVDLQSKLLKNIQWNDGSVSDVRAFSNEGKYSISAIDTSGCNVTDSFYLKTIKLPDFETQDTITICSSETTVLSIPNELETEYIWNIGSTASEITVMAAGTYIVTVTNICGEEQAEFIVAVESDCSTPFFYPNIFSPNNDGVNDVFEITSKNASITNLVIYDRWGNMVYRNANEYKWDGKHNNNIVSEGVYTAIINYLMNGKDNIKIANVTLIW